MVCLIVCLYMLDWLFFFGFLVSLMIVCLIVSLGFLFSFSVCFFDLLPRSFIHPSLIPSSIPSSVLHRPSIDPSSTLHWSLPRSFIDPSLIPSSILHRPFIDPFIDPSSTLHQPKTTPRPPQDQDKTAHWKSIDFSSQWWVGDDVGDGHFYRESLCERMTILWNKRRTNVALSSKFWFGDDVGDGHFYREPLCENDNSMKQETHKCTFFFQMLIWRWRWRWALLQRILVREWQFYETRDAQM